MNAEQFEAHCAEKGVYLQPVPVPNMDAFADCVDDVLQWLRRQVEGDDCYCGDSVKCDACWSAELLKRLQKAFEVEHRSLHPERLVNHSERIYLESWKARQERSPGFNGGWGLLDHILTPYRQVEPSGYIGVRGKYEFVPPVSQRDAEVAASVIQWLGTNCGLSFTMECERRINEARKTHGEFDRATWDVMPHRKDPPPPESKAAILSHEVAARAAPAGTKKYEDVRNATLAAFKALGLHIAAAAAMEAATA